MCELKRLACTGRFGDAQTAPARLQYEEDENLNVEPLTKVIKTNILL